MANFTALKTAINNAIKTNGNEEITGAILQAILDAMVETLGDSAITNLENAITAEVANRGNAVGNVAADLTAEVQARQALDYNVNNRINAEEYNRQNADAALSQTMSQGFQTLGSQMTALNAAISALNAAYQNGFLYGGIATPSSSPSNSKCFYIALQGGTYTNFGGVGVVEGINIIKNDSGWKVEHIYDQTTLLNEFYLLRQQVIQAITSFDPIVIEGDVTNAPDEEDLTSNAQHLLQFKNNAYSPLEFSGLGRKYLRKNIAPLSESAPFNGFVEGVTAEETLSGTPTQIFWDRMNTRFVGIKDGVYYLDWTDSDNYVPVSTSLVYMYNGTPYQWTGSDFIVDETEVPNLVNCLTQDMINEANTIYIIRYDYTLKENITIPANCVLQFDGGSIYGDNIKTISFTNTKIVAEPYRIFYNVKFYNNSNDPDSIYLLKNDNVLADWFVNPSEDCGSDINNALSICRELILSNNTTYIVNTTINLNSYKSIIFGTSSILKKTSNPEAPIIYIVGLYNSISSNSKSSGLKSTVITPYGLIAIAEYNETISETMTVYNKINGIRLEGVRSTDVNSLSVGLYCKGTHTSVGRYYNSITNLYFIYFNIGIHILGDFNANFFRDLMFTYVGGSFDNYVRNNEKEAAIILEHLYTINTGWGPVIENSISQIFHTASLNAVSILIKGAVRYNIFQGINAEVGGQGALTIKAIKKENEISHAEMAATNNIFIEDGISYSGSQWYDGFKTSNVLVSGSGNCIYTKVFEGTTFNGGEFSGNNFHLKNSDYLNNFVVKKQASYRIENNIAFDVCQLSMISLGEANILTLKVTNLAAHQYVSSRIFTIYIKKENETPSVRFIMKSDQDDDDSRIIRLAEPYISGNNIKIRLKTPNKGAPYAQFLSIEAEYQCYDNYRAGLFTMYAEPTISDSTAADIKVRRIGITAERPTYPAKGDYYLDTEIGKLIFVSNIAINGTVTWVDATGTTV